jgi:kynurenine 3-monooxygenase
MSNRGWKALDAVEVGDAVREIAIPMDKRAIHLVDKLNFQNYGQEGEAIYSISRGILNRKMINLAEEAGIFFNQKIWDVTLKEATLHMGESERGIWEEKNTILSLALTEHFQEFDIACVKACLITHKSF